MDTKHRAISDIRPFEREVEIFHAPAMRVIGKEARSGGALGNAAPALAEATMQSPIWALLEALPRVLPYGVGWTCDFDPATGTFSYIVGFLTPANTPVPEGCAYRDVSATLCARGLLGEDAGQTAERAKALGYTTNWENAAWNTEFYIPEEEATWTREDAQPCHWLVPVREAV